jgi:hypothetical protein
VKSTVYASFDWSGLMSISPTCGELLALGEHVHVEDHLLGRLHRALARQ